jgi:hypothetical protein
MGENSKMNAAYQMAATLLRDRLAKEDKENIELLDQLDKTDVVVIDGSFDHIHLVLDSLKIPYLRLTQNLFHEITLRPEQTVFVNCSSAFPEDGARKLAGFVASGGQMVTTDWALKTVLEVGFNGFVRYNQRPTSDEVVAIELAQTNDPTVKGFIGEQDQPVWWLEGSSYPIQILKPDAVNVLIKSKELKEKYGEEAVIIRFKYGEGTVYHMISHFYLQRSETREAKKNMSVGSYAKAKGASKEYQKWAEEAAKAGDVDYSSVQSASNSAEFVSRTILKQKKKFTKG